MIFSRGTLPAHFRPAHSARLRLTLAFTVLVVIVGVAIVSSVIFSMTFLTDYRISASGATITREGGSATATDQTEVGSAPIMGSLDIVTVSGRDDILRVLLTTSLIVFAGVLILGVTLSWIMAGRVLRPVAAITTAAREASEGRLDQLIALAGPPDEFKRLADTFDEMLGRLDDSLQAHRRFAANASHELKSPLATTQAMLDVALLDPAAVDTERLVTRLRETNARNIETVEALLALADAQAAPMAHSDVDLGPLVRDALSACRAQIEAASVTVVCRPRSLVVRGDPVLLRLLFRNLVENAFRHNVSGGDVVVDLAGDAVTIENTGARLEPEQVERLTEPFFRAAGRIQGSHGLGLAIVRAIADRHGATLDLAARQGGGLTVRVTFPDAAGAV